MKRVALCVALIGVVICLITGCKFKDPSIPGHSGKPMLSFKKVEGITFTEVRRQQNGLSFNEYGYHLSPDWRLRFVSSDSVALYSPVKKRFLNFPLSCGIDSVFNTNRSFLRMKHMSKDSLVFELLEAKDDSLDIRGTKVYMLFYADNYIKNVLHTNAATLQRSNRKDSLFVKQLIKRADSSLTNAFAALTPVRLTSTRSSITVKKKKTIADFLLNNYNTSDDYMNPVYNITINKADSDFDYAFSAYVDKEGKLIYNTPITPFTEGRYKQRYVRLSKAIMNTYLKLYVKVQPGQTLGVPHTTLISLYLHGKKS
ncbi:hypothetical protein EWM62_11230 [Mucilaginibacter terrigena]|uniref:Uncharacterized protein n=1 Tax=Mucilaginibacter terrigena TaxID=2492395 RepID=A0A4Q5LKM1_9SPHI|nr:hypothetical protein [Mucilaginibacter terrigena]RYU90107.1 hypothetical protein EWM62_11230 [Mucilaginibacter terrigena]